MQSKAVSFKVPFSGKSRAYTPDEIQAVVDSMQSNESQTQGKYQERFQKAFSEFNGVAHSFAVSSATAALELSALLCRLKPGDEVIIPAHTFTATAIPFARTGAKIVWADIDPKTWVVSAASIQKNVTKNTRAIVVVHLYGLTADMDPIMDIAKKNKLFIIEDCAQSIGAEYKGKKAGSFGDFGCFSFHTHKNITTLGEGGMLTVRDAELASKVPGLRHNGIRPYPPRESYWKPAMSLVDFDYDGLWPYNFCIGEPQCALGIELLKKVDGVIRHRTERARVFKEALRGYPELIFQIIPDGMKSAFHLLPARYEGKDTHRDDLIAKMAYEHAVQLVVQYYPLFRYPMFQKAGFGNADCPNTETFFDNMVSFPFHEWLPEIDFQTMIDATKRSLDELRRK